MKCNIKLSKLEGKNSWGNRLSILMGCVMATDAYHILEVGVHRGDFPRVLSSKLDFRYTGVDIDFSNLRFMPDKDDPRFSLLKMSSVDFWNELGDEVRFDMIFVDGGHDKQTAMLDVLAAKKHLAKEGVMLIHDIANEKFQDDGPHRAFFDICAPAPDVIGSLVWHEDGWLGIVTKGLGTDDRIHQELSRKFGI